MLGKFKAISDRAYNWQKALEEANLKQNDIDEFRSRVEELENVPKTILDKQVIIKFTSDAFIYLAICFSYFRF